MENEDHYKANVKYSFAPLFQVAEKQIFTNKK